MAIYYDDTRIPIASIGMCHNALNCHQWKTDLADGWCVKCWDRGLNNNGGLQKVIERRQKKEQAKHEKALAKQLKEQLKAKTKRGRHKKNCDCEWHRLKDFPHLVQTKEIKFKDFR